MNTYKILASLDTEIHPNNIGIFTVVADSYEIAKAILMLNKSVLSIIGEMK